MDRKYILNPAGTLDSTYSPITALCFMVKNGSTYLLGGSIDGMFFIFCMDRRRLLNHASLGNAIIEIHHHPTRRFEIITRERYGNISFWTLDANFLFGCYHSVYIDAEFPRTIIADNNILFPHQDVIQILHFDELKCFGPMRILDGLEDSEFGIHTELLSIRINNDWYVFSGYFNGSLIARELRPGGFSLRFTGACPSAVRVMVYNQETQDILISYVGGNELIVYRVSIEPNGHLALHTMPKISIGFSSSLVTIDSRYCFLFCSLLGQLKIYNLKTSRFYPLLPETISYIHCMSSSPQGVSGWTYMYMLAVAYSNGNIRFWLFSS